MIIDIPTFSDRRGDVSILEHLSFVIERVFYIYNVQDVRGCHALKTCHQILVAVAGTLSVTVEEELFHLTSPRYGLYIPPMTWRELSNFSPGSVCLVLASEPYDEGDYVRDRDEFESLRV